MKVSLRILTPKLVTGLHAPFLKPPKHKYRPSVALPGGFLIGEYYHACIFIHSIYTRSMKQVWMEEDLYAKLVKLATTEKRSIKMQLETLLEKIL